MSFQKELTKLINKHSRENLSDTPDYILALYLVRCLQNFEMTSIARDRHSGKESKPMLLLTENPIDPEAFG